MLTYKGKEYVCHLDFGMEMVRSKWKAVILCHLNDGPKRFLELQRTVTGVTQKVINEKLKELEEDGLIEKTYTEVPPRVEFRLTQAGKELFPALDMIQKWAEKHYSKQTSPVQPPP